MKKSKLRNIIREIIKEQFRRPFSKKPRPIKPEKPESDFPDFVSLTRTIEYCECDQYDAQTNTCNHSPHINPYFMIPVGGSQSTGPYLIPQVGDKFCASIPNHINTGLRSDCPNPGSNNANIGMVMNVYPTNTFMGMNVAGLLLNQNESCGSTSINPCDLTFLNNSIPNLIATNIGDYCRACGLLPGQTPYNQNQDPTNIANMAMSSPNSNFSTVNDVCTHIDTNNCC